MAESLREVGASLSHSLNLADILASVLSYARVLFGADACAVHELQPDGRTLSIRSAVGLSSEYVLRSRARVGAGVTGRAVEKGQLVFSHDVSREAQGGGSRYTRQLLAAGKYPYRGVVGLPLSARGNVFGGLSLYYTELLPLDAEELALTEVFAAQAALAIENARLYEDEVRRERESAVLLSVASRLQSPIAPGALSAVARELTLALGAERGLIVTLGGGENDPAEAGEANRTHQRVGPERISQVACYNLPAAPDSEQLSWLVSQLGRGPRPLTRRHLLGGAASGLLAPVQHQGSLLGLFYADQSQEEVPGERSLHLARSLSDQVALSLSRERLLSALAREEARYRLLAHSAHDLIIAADTAGTITYANPASLRLLGPLEGYGLTTLISAPAFLDAWQACLSDARQRGTLRGDGQRRLGRAASGNAPLCRDRRRRGRCRACCWWRATSASCRRWPRKSSAGVRNSKRSRHVRASCGSFCRCLPRPRRRSAAASAANCTTTPPRCWWRWAAAWTGWAAA